MTELRLKYKDHNANDQEVVVEGEKFTVGRHTQCDLCVPDSRLSREHVVIERFGDVFVISDKGSSNGTSLNGEPLTEPKGLQNGDKLDLGGAIEILVAFVDPNAKDADGAEAPPAPPPPPAPAAASATSSGGGFPTSLLILAPLMAIIVVVFVGGLYYVFSDRSKAVASQTNDDFDLDDNFDNKDVPPLRQTSNAEDAPAEPRSNVNAGQTTPSTELSPPTTSSPSGSPGSTSPPPTTAGSDPKVEVHAAAFLRRIADNDPKAFVTSEQASRISAKINQLGSSQTLAANLGNAKRNSQKIKELATARNLKPQFLAIAAINRLGSNRGDVSQAAAGMTEVLDKLLAQIGTESADDATLIIAAYDQGAAGDHMKMRNMLQDLSNKFPESTRAIRTIWFLHKNQKISDAEFDRALTFIAIGTISQNPKDFGVNAEALVF